MRVAFYAPLKAPDHPIPSGDRTMARAIVKALRMAGHDVTQPSPLRSFLPAPDWERQRGLFEEAGREIERIASRWEASGPPDAWFTYHNHYKAPDLIGPALTRRFALPYVMAEASHAPKRAGEWTSWHRAAEDATRAADQHVCFTTRDREGIASLVKPGSAVLDLPPFLDLDEHIAHPPMNRDGVFRLITVAMMRYGDKLASYAFLAEALRKLGNAEWQLDVIGDGPARDVVLTHFAAMSSRRLSWHGVMSREAAWQRMGEAHLFVWPGFGEAYGLAYLEAQAAGLPVLALDVAGVNAVVQHGITGLLVTEPSPSAYAATLLSLISDRSALDRMGAAASQFIQTRQIK